MKHHKNLLIEVLPIQSQSPLFVLNLKLSLQASEQLIFSFLFSKDYLENLNEVKYSFSSKRTCCPCSHRDEKASDIKTCIEKNFQSSESLESFLEKHGFWTKDMNLKKFEGFLLDILKETNNKIINPLKSNMTIFTESSQSSHEKYIVIKESKEDKIVEKRLHLLERLGTNSHGHIELSKEENSSNILIVRFFRYPRSEDMKTSMIKDISRLFMKKTNKLKHNNILSYPHRLLRVISNGATQKLVDVCVLAEYGGVNMEVYLKEHKKLTSSQAKSFIKEIFKGVSYLRENQEDYTYCNLKPSNILISNKKEVKIDYLNFSDIDINPPDSIYVAPELRKEIHHLPADYIKADVFSLGALYYYFLTSKPLFKDGDENKIYLKEDLDIDLEEGIDKSAQELLRKMLKYDHNQRISWEKLNEFFSENNSNSLDSSNEEEETKLDQILIKSFKGCKEKSPIENTTIAGAPVWVNNEETLKVDGYIEHLKKLLVFLADFHNCISKNRIFLNFKPGDYHILNLFIKKIGMVQVIEVATQIEKIAHEDQWKYFCFLTSVFNENVKIDYEGLASEMILIGKMPYLNIIKFHNEKTTFDQCEGNLREALLNFEKELQDKKNEFELEKEKQKKLEFLSCCFTIFLDLNKNIIDNNGLIARFDSFRNSMGIQDSLSNLFLSQDDELNN